MPLRLKRATAASPTLHVALLSDSQSILLHSLTLVPTTTSGTPRLWLNTEASRGRDTPLPLAEGWAESADPTFSGSMYPWKCDTTERVGEEDTVAAIVPNVLVYFRVIEGNIQNLDFSGPRRQISYSTSAKLFASENSYYRWQVYPCINSPSLNTLQLV